jgi:transketolase
MPNMVVIVPGDYEEAKQATIASARIKGPVYLRFGRDCYPLVEAIHGGFTIGKAKLLRHGSDVTIVTTGIMVSEGLQAAETLDREGVSARVFHLPTVKPLDGDALLGAARETRGFVTAEEHSIIGGLGEAVSSFLAEHLPRPVRRVGMKDVFGESGMAAELMDRYGLRACNIASEARALLAENK